MTGGSRLLTAVAEGDEARIRELLADDVAFTAPSPITAAGPTSPT